MRYKPVGGSGLGLAHTQCANGEKKSNLRRGPVEPKKGAHLTRLGVGWSQLRAPGPQNRSGGRKKGGFCALKAAFWLYRVPGRTRVAAVIDWLRVCTLGFFSTAGTRRDPANCKIRHLGTKTIDIIYQSFCPLWWLLEPRSWLL